MSKQAQELKDLNVDRVDGVDRPATGRNFLLFKSQDGQVEKVASDAIMKGYGMVATAAAEVLKAIRVDANATVSRKSAIALNGLAQVLGQDAPFVAKSVPTQPYVVTEPDVDQRGPADEKLGSNFVARNAAMVDTVSFETKGYDKDGDEMVDGKGKSKKKDAAAEKPAETQKDATAEALSSLAKAIEGLVASQKSMPGDIVKALVAGPEGVAKSEDGDVETVRPRSRQVQADDAEPKRRVRKSDYEPRFEASFSDVVFSPQPRQ